MVLRLGTAVVALAALLGAVSTPADAATLPPGFQETVVFSGLTNPTAVRFSPDGRVFVAEKSGLIKVFDSLTDTTPSIYADLRTKVHSFNDRGLLGLALDPSFPTVQDIYVSYAHDAAIGGTAPRWGQPDTDADGCPTPPGPNLDGCVISGRLSRLRPGGGAGTPYDQAVLADAPRAYWRLGDGSGTTMADASGNGQAGTYVDTPTLGAPGALAGSSNTAVGFNGTTEHATVPFNTALNPAAFSVEAWAHVTGGQGTYRAVVSSRDYAPGNARGFILYAASDNTWQFWVGNGTAGGWGRAFGPTIALNTWTHLAGTYDGTTARLYVNGALAASTASPYSANTARPLRIAAGRNEGAPDYLFPGRVDEAAVYGSALSSTRVQAHYTAGTGGSGGSGITETVLVEDWCQQFPTGSVGALEFGSGSDGGLYMAGGSGGSFTFNDWGQEGSPPNPCGDPPGGVGATLTPPTAEGGWLRSQDLRTSGDPAGLGGTLIRVDKNTGAALSDNPLFSSGDANARRIVAYGLRNPFRIAIRPGTREVWVGDVGAGSYEEIDRVVNATDATVENFGWPCYEGAGRQGGYDAADLTICENLYAQSGAVTAPFFSYVHGSTITPGENCPAGSSASSGLAFAPTTGLAYPATYAGRLFFADYGRNCIWTMTPDANGVPVASSREVFIEVASFPVDLRFGPDGKLYYVDVGIDGEGGGAVRRIDFFSGNQPPTAVATANPTSGPAPLAVSFNGSGSSDPDGSITAYAWDLDGDGAFDDSTAVNPTFTYTATGNYTVRLRVTDNQGAPGTSAPITIAVGNNAPTAVIDTPAASFLWRASEAISFSGHATDPQDGTIPASGLSWEVLLQHCSTPTSCHSHLVQSFTGVASGTFSAPDHEYPSYLELKLTARDSGGLTNTVVRRLDPKTVTLTMQSAPSGLQLVVNSTTGTTPFTYTAVEGATTTISAPTPQTLSGQNYAFSSWSDGGAQTHTLSANASATYTATYTAGGPPPAYSAAVLADSPAAYWRLGESSGTAAADAGPNGFGGTYVAAPSLGAPGAIAGDSNTSVAFDGTSERVDVAYRAGLNTAQFSVEAWVYVTGGAGRYRAVVSNRDYAPGNSRGWILYAAADDTWQLWQGNGNGSWERTFGPAVQLNTWTHLVGTFDGATARLYVNGTQAASSTPSPYATNATRPLRVAAGRNEGAGDYYLPGRVDEVSVYPTALSAARVQAHHAAGTGGGGGSNQPPTAVASATPTSGAAPLSVSFNGAGSSDPDGSITAYAWDLDGDSAFDDSTAQNPQHTYTAAGTYTARLRVTDNQGAQDDSDPVTITVTGGGGTTYAQSVLADSPAAYWRLGDSASPMTDSSGGGASGVYFGPPTFGAAGALVGDANTAVGFSGSGQYAQAPFAAALNSAQFTVEAWAYVTGGQGTYRSIVTSRDSATGNRRGYTLYAGSNDGWQFWLGTGTDSWRVAFGPALSLNTWTHVVGTWDGTTARLYVNGTLVGSSTGAFAANAVRPLRIAAGATEGAASFLFTGRVDEVAVYSTALTQERVQAHFTASGR